MPIKSFVAVLLSLAVVGFILDRPSSAVLELPTRAITAIVTTNGFGFGVRRAAFRVSIPTTAAPKPTDSVQVMMQGPNLDLQAGDVIALRIEGPDNIVDIGDLTLPTPDGVTLKTLGTGLGAARNATMGGFRARVSVRFRNTSVRVMIRLSKGRAGNSPSIPAAATQNGVPIVLNLMILRGNTLFHARELQNFLIKKKTNRRGLTRIQGRHRT